MKVKDAVKITHTLSKPGKMPGPAYSISAKNCITGAKLAKVPGSVCAGCYALKGRYMFKNTKSAHQLRQESLSHPQWVEAMAVQIKSHKWFRWHDAGDLQSVQHLNNIISVCKLTPGTMHWLPTREAQILKEFTPDMIPTNLIIRLSSHMINQGPVKQWPHTSTVTDGEGRTCPAPDQGGICGECRSCWDRDTKNVCYGKH